MVRKLSIISLFFVVSVCVSFAQHVSSYLIAFEAKGHVRTIVTNSYNIKTTAKFSYAGELTIYGDQYGQIPFERSDRDFTITGRDPESAKYIFDYNNDRIARVEGTGGQFNYKDRYEYSSNGDLVRIHRTLYDGFDEAGTQVIPVKVIEKDSKGNWTVRTIGDDTYTRTIIYYGDNEEAASTGKYLSWYKNLNKRFKVRGGVGIEQFITALGIYDPARPSRHVVDKKNGFFATNQEGAGHFICNAAYWNRKDGKKLFIVAYDYAEFFAPNEDEAVYGDSWYYSSVEKANDIVSRYEVGFRAYLYEPATSELVPLKQVPFNNWPKTPEVHYLDLPQKGKDITVRIGYDFIRQHSSRIMKWNGMTFDY